VTDLPDDFQTAPLADVDPEIASVLDRELGRQQDTLEMIASENFVPQAVLDAVDGKPVTSCDLPVDAVAGQAVETIELVASQDPASPLVDAFLAEQAGQCGYCLAGIVMRAKALLAENSAPTRSEIAAALAGNLCRCGAHNRILRAIERAGQATRGEAGA